MKVVCTKPGFDGEQQRMPGEVFVVPDGSKASWYEPFAPGKAVTAAPVVDDEPRTLSELASRPPVSGHARMQKKSKPSDSSDLV